MAETERILIVWNMETRPTLTVIEIVESAVYAVFSGAYSSLPKCKVIPINNELPDPEIEFTLDMPTEEEPDWLYQYTLNLYQYFLKQFQCDYICFMNE